MSGPSEVELGQLHERLLAGDPVAPAELAQRLLPLLRARLAGWAATVDDPHLVPSAIGLVIARYLSDPERFDPERGGLAGYLAMEVRGDVLNELDSRRRRRQHESPAAELVELEPHGRDSTVEEKRWTPSTRSESRRRPSRPLGRHSVSSTRWTAGCWR